MATEEPGAGGVEGADPEILADLFAAQAAEAHAKGVERAAKSRLEQERRDLDTLVTAGPTVLEPQTTIANWASSDHFTRDDVVFADEAFGRFGTEGVQAAFYWDYPDTGTPAFWAFRAYRDFDGKGGSFQDESVPVANDVAM